MKPTAAQIRFLKLLSTGAIVLHGASETYPEFHWQTYCACDKKGWLAHVDHYYRGKSGVILITALGAKVLRESTK